MEESEMKDQDDPDHPDRTGQVREPRRHVPGHAEHEDQASNSLPRAKSHSRVRGLAGRELRSGFKKLAASIPGQANR
jgi:hypothetical protein